ncbi:MAG: DUF3047 domain-containing protein [Stenotrophobium sp.]
MKAKILVFGVLIAGAFSVQAQPGTFSTQGLAGWQPQTFKGRTETAYELVQDDGVQVLQARCDRSASGLIWKEPVDLKRTPVLSWRWRVDRVYADAEQQEKRGDDFPARVYVVRDGGWAIWRTVSLVYVWANGREKTGDWADPYTRQAHIIALGTGDKALGHWHSERRDVRADFKTYFGMDVDKVDAVAVMSDCDDTGNHSVSEYGDLGFDVPSP